MEDIWGECPHDKRGGRMKVVKLTDFEAYAVLSMIDAIQKCPLKTMKALNKVYRKICEAEEEE